MCPARKEHPALVYCFSSTQLNNDSLTACKRVSQVVFYIHGCPYLYSNEFVCKSNSLQVFQRYGWIHEISHSTYAHKHKINSFIVSNVNICGYTVWNHRYTVVIADFHHKPLRPHLFVWMRSRVRSSCSDGCVLLSGPQSSARERPYLWRYDFGNKGLRLIFFNL